MSQSQYKDYIDNNGNYVDSSEDSDEQPESFNNLMTQEVSFLMSAFTQPQSGRIQQGGFSTSTDESDTENKTIVVTADIHNNNSDKLPVTSESIINLSDDLIVKRKNLFTQSSQIIISPPDLFLTTQIKQDNNLIQDGSDTDSIMHIFKKAITAKDISEELYHSDFSNDVEENDLDDDKSLHNSQSSNKAIFNSNTENKIIPTNVKFSQDLYEIENLSQGLSLNETIKNTTYIKKDSDETLNKSQQYASNITNISNNTIQISEDKIILGYAPNITQNAKLCNTSVQTEVLTDITYLISRKRHLDALHLECPKRLKVHTLPLVLSDNGLETFLAQVIPTNNDGNQLKKSFSNSYTQTDVNVFLDNKTLSEKPRPMRIGLSRKSSVHKPLHRKSNYFFGN